MDFASSTLVALILCLSAAALIFWHIRTWRALQSEPLGPRERDFRRRQYRRRMQTSAMLGVLGAAIFVGQLLMLWIHSRLFFAIYWGGVLLLVLWMALLALADIVATQFHYSREKTENVIERAKLQAEIRRRAAHGNGKKE